MNISAKAAILSSEIILIATTNVSKHVDLLDKQELFMCLCKKILLIIK